MRSNFKKLFFAFFAALFFILHFNYSVAAETPIGQPIEKNGMEISTVYLQPVEMQHDLVMTYNGHPDIHLEVDVRAVKNNPNGFAVGEWVPYLQITYHIRKTGTNWEQIGNLVPMVASDGPHYGLNVQLNGAGKYEITYHINPPSWNAFHRHTDKETGVNTWWKPFDVKFEFTYLGTGKKGGY